MKPLLSTEIFGNWGTLLLPLGDQDQILYDQLEAEIDTLISMKVNGIYSNGTAGEFHNQTEEEFDRINSLLAEKCTDAGMPFQVGCSHMSPILSLERVKRAVQFRPGAIQVILPDWFPPVMAEIVTFLKKIIETADGIGIVLYNPPHSKIKFQPADFKILKDCGVELSGTKLAGGDEQWYRDMKLYAPGLSVFIPGHHLATGIARGAHGAYSNVACLNPLKAQHWFEMMAEDMPRALELESRIQKFMNDLIVPFISEKGYSNPSVDKFMAAVGGWTNISPRLRWPYRWISEDEIEKVRIEAEKILPEFFNDEL